MNMISKTGQVNIFYVLFTSIIFLSLMFLGVGKWVNTTLGFASATAGMTGLEAFLFNNLLLWIFFAFILWFMISSSQ